MKLNQNILKKIAIEARAYFRGASGCHDFSHVERVYKLAMNIGRQEKADLLILGAACWLHDIGRKKEMDSRGRIDHAIYGEEMARKILKKYKIDQDIINSISHCIISHRYRNDHIPKTIEARVLSDSDKLDSIGAVGVGRTFLFAGYIRHAMYGPKDFNLRSNKQDFCYSQDDTGVREYEFKLKNVKDKIITKTAKKIAKSRHDYMVQYFRRFKDEIDGKK